MTRLLFEKTADAVWISHLDLMRLFQRAFKRAGLPLKHTQGFSPRPSVSIALPLSVGVESSCELLDFETDGQTISCEEMTARLNAVLPHGVRVLKTYDSGDKIRNIAFLDCYVRLAYDNGVPNGAEESIRALFSREELLVEKKSKKGDTLQNIIPMIRAMTVISEETSIMLCARICCQNPTLNPMQLAAAIETYLPNYKPDFIACKRVEIYDTNETVFR